MFAYLFAYMQTNIQTYILNNVSNITFIEYY